ncbi:hypothetical protein HYW46_04485 [Candidatus Daviesbacteria bacterium]|nr:hypothetical protein [Candidatus Daviesbacteria bacterium]
MNNINWKYLLIPIALIILGLLGGYLYAYRTAIPLLSVQSPNQPKTSSPDIKKEPIFTAKTALVEGVILKIEGREIIVKNNQGIVQNLSLSKNLVIYRFAKQNKTATPSSDLKSIRFNTRSIINLELINGNYEVVSITQ